MEGLRYVATIFLQKEWRLKVSALPPEGLETKGQAHG